MSADQLDEKTRAREIDNIDNFLIRFDETVTTIEESIKIRYDIFYEPGTTDPTGPCEKNKDEQ